MPLFRGKKKYLAVPTSIQWNRDTLLSTEPDIYDSVNNHLIITFKDQYGVLMPGLSFSLTQTAPVGMIMNLETLGAWTNPSLTKANGTSTEFGGSPDLMSGNYTINVSSGTFTTSRIFHVEI